MARETHTVRLNKGGEGAFYQEAFIDEEKYPLSMIRYDAATNILFILLQNGDEIEAKVREINETTDYTEYSVLWQDWKPKDRVSGATAHPPNYIPIGINEVYGNNGDIQYNGAQITSEEYIKAWIYALQDDTWSRNVSISGNWNAFNLPKREVGLCFCSEELWK